MPHPTSQKFLYPPARRDAVVDDYHGTPVADPYRWLEDPQAPETRAWLEAQHQLTSALLAAMPTRDSIKARLTELWNYPRYSVQLRRHSRGNELGRQPRRDPPGVRPLPTRQRLAGYQHSPCRYRPGLHRKPPVVSVYWHRLEPR